MDKFVLFKKWFWIGIIITLVHPLAGLIYGIALVFEKNLRKEGWILIIFALIFGIIGYFVSTYFSLKGVYIPVQWRWQLIKPPKPGEILFPK